MPMTREQFLSLKEGDFFYFYNRYCFDIDDPDSRTRRFVVETLNDQLVGISSQSGHNKLFFAIDGEEYDTIHKYDDSVLFSTRQELDAVYESEQQRVKDLILQADRSKILNDLFTGWYGDNERSLAQYSAMKQQIHYLFGIDIKR